MKVGELSGTNMVLVHPSELARVKDVFLAEGAGSYINLITPCVFVPKANMVKVEKSGAIILVKLEEGL